MLRESRHFLHKNRQERPPRGGGGDGLTAKTSAGGPTCIITALAAVPTDGNVEKNSRKKFRQYSQLLRSTVCLIRSEHDILFLSTTSRPGIDRKETACRLLTLLKRDLHQRRPTLLNMPDVNPADIIGSSDHRSIYDSLQFGTNPCGLGFAGAMTAGLQEPQGWSKLEFPAACAAASGGRLGSAWPALDPPAWLLSSGPAACGLK